MSLLHSCIDRLICQNTESLAKWLNAKYYNSKYVPVPIEEYLVHDRYIYPVSTSSAFFKSASQLGASQPLSGILPAREIERSEYKELKNEVSNAVVSLAVETAKAGFGALVFCSGRQGCQSTAALISEAMPIPAIVDDVTLDRRHEVVSELRSLPIDLDETLEKTVVRGVAFHRLCSCVQKAFHMTKFRRCWSDGRGEGYSCRGI